MSYFLDEVDSLKLALPILSKTDNGQEYEDCLQAVFLFYSARFAEAEIRAVAMWSDLVGYDRQQSAGIFTFGGTSTILL